MKSQPNFNHLYRFWIVAQEGSLLGASRQLGVRHSTLSSQIRALEEALGMRLLIRRPRGMRLTPQAEVVRNYCDQIFRLGTELVDATAEERVNRLRVAMLASVPRSLLYDAIRPALEREKATRMELGVTDLQAASRALVTGQIHVVFSDRLPAGAGSGPIHFHLISETRIGLFATARVAQRYGGRFPDNLDGAPVLLPSPGGPLREGLAAWFAQEGVRPRIVGEFDDAPMMNSFAARGHGFVPIRMALARETRQRYSLVAAGVVPGLVDRLYALTLGKRVRHPGIQRLIDQCRGKFGTRSRTGGPQ